MRLEPKSAVVLSLVLIANSLLANDPNPFLKTSVGIHGGYNIGFSAGFFHSGSLGLSSDFKAYGDETSKDFFALLLGPRIDFFSFSQITARDDFPVSMRLVNLDLSIKPVFYTGDLRSGFIAAYIDVLIGLSAGLIPSKGGIWGANYGILVGIQYYWDQHFGIFGEAGSRSQILGASGYDRVLIMSVYEGTVGFAYAF